MGDEIKALQDERRWEQHIASKESHGLKPWPEEKKMEEDLERCERRGHLVDTDNIYSVDYKGVEETWCGDCIIEARDNGEEVEKINV